MKKRFGTTYYHGRVVDYEVVEDQSGKRRHFLIHYDDGDAEHLCLADLYRLLTAKDQQKGLRPRQQRTFDPAFEKSVGRAADESPDSEADPLVHRWVMSAFLDGYLKGFVHHRIAAVQASKSPDYLVVWADGAVETMSDKQVAEGITTFLSYCSVFENMFHFINYLLTKFIDCSFVYLL